MTFKIAINYLYTAVEQVELVDGVGKDLGHLELLSPLAHGVTPQLNKVVRNVDDDDLLERNCSNNLFDLF